MFREQGESRETTDSQSDSISERGTDPSMNKPSGTYQLQYLTEVSIDGELIPLKSVLVRRYQRHRKVYRHQCLIDSEIHQMFIRDPELLPYFSPALEIVFNALVQSGFNPERSQVQLYVWRDHEIPGWMEIILRVLIPHNGPLDRRRFWRKLDSYIYQRFPAAFLKTRVEEY